MATDNDNRLLGADGRPIDGDAPAEAPPFTPPDPGAPVIVRFGGIALPLPCSNGEWFASQHCVRQVEQIIGADANGAPRYGLVPQLAISPDVGLTWLEIGRALEQRDERIARLERELHELKLALHAGAPVEEPAPLEQSWHVPVLTPLDQGSGEGSSDDGG